MNPYVKLSVASFLPAVLSVILYFLEKYTKFKNIPYKYKQIIIGILFGGLSVLGTEFGIPINGAQVNCRDAAPLAAGLFFGAPAGIIAGCIGGIERYVAVAWGVGSYTRIACSVSTILAGFYSAGLRKYMFENKKPGVFISLAIGTVMESFHMMMVFFTNMNTPDKALEIVKNCSIVMIPANGLSVMITALLLSLLFNEGVKKQKTQVRIAQTIQRWLLLTVFLAFAATSLFIFSFQDKIADLQATSLLSTSVEETGADIMDASDENLLSLAKVIKRFIDKGETDLKAVAKEYNVAEISIIDKNGIIVKSTGEEYLGFDMASGEQSSEFLCLLGNTTEFVQKYGQISSDESIFRKYAGIKTEEGFLQVGYDAETFHSNMKSQIIGLTKNRHVGHTGYIMILDENLNIISAPKEITQRNLVHVTDKLELPNSDISFEMNVNGIPSRCLYKVTEGFYIFSVLPETEAIQTRDNILWINSFIEILVFAVLYAIIYFLIKKFVVNKIKTINGSLAKIADGNLNEVVNVRTSEEFSSLSDDINSTVDTLKTYIDEASARIDKELEFAKNIQVSALPANFENISKRNDFDIYASMNPAKEVGGDFYDFYYTDKNRLHFLIADVSGKGIPAAMFMMRAKTELKSLTEANLPINDVFTRGNAELCNGNDAGMFVTAWQGGLDLSTGVVRFANAGHNPPLVRHKDGKFEYLKSKVGFVLAGMDGLKYKEQELQLEPGDIIYLYTDGVTEATDANKELYGEERLLNAINSKEFASMKELCQYVKADVDAFVGEAPQFDDITMVAVKYHGTATIRVENAKIEDINTVTAFVEEELEKVECPMKTTIQINVAIDELFSNIVKYGYAEYPGPVTVKVLHSTDPRAVYVRFEDEGIPYNPLTKEDPDVTLSAEERNIGGLGIYMVKKTMDSVKYKYENNKNILTIKKLY